MNEETANPATASPDEAAQIADPVLFEARLTPHRSLSPRGFIILMTATAMIGFIYGMAFVLMGAWPIVGFLGTEWLLFWWLFRTHFHGDGRIEWLRLYRDRLRLDRGDRRGIYATVEFQSYWLQVLVTPDGSVENALHLRSHGHTEEIGRFLSPGERLHLAEDLRRALARNRTS